MDMDAHLIGPQVKASLADAMGRMSRPIEGAGAIWRIRVAQSGRFLYRHGDNVIATPSFFSLFRLLPRGQGEYTVLDHAGDALYVQRPDEVLIISTLCTHYRGMWRWPYPATILSLALA
eukprot:559496-Pleurochrysis_carterae.AAC.2